jgi:hypothetical protein
LIGRGNVVVNLWWKKNTLEKAILTPNLSGEISVRYQGNKKQFFANVGEEITLNSSLQKI